MVNRFCKCSHHLAGKPDAAANFYNDRFIPAHWALNYFKLSECWGVSLMGCCKDCGGELEEIISLPNGLTGDALFQAIYDIVQTAHPYDVKSDALGYYGRCKERSAFYKRRDNRKQPRRSKEFLELFNDWDREAARLWLEKNFPPEKHTEVFRDTEVCSAPWSAWHKPMAILARRAPSWIIIYPVSMREARENGSSSLPMNLTLCPSSIMGARAFTSTAI